MRACLRRQFHLPFRRRQERSVRTRPRRHTVRPVNRADITCQQPSTLSSDTRPRRHTVRPVNRTDTTCQQLSTLSPDTPGPAATRSDLSTEQTQPVNNCQRYPQTHQAPPPHGPTCQQNRDHLSTTVNAIPRHQAPPPHGPTCQQSRDHLSTTVNAIPRHQAPPPHGPTCRQSRHNLSTTVNAIPRHTRPRRHTVRPVNRTEITCQQPSTLSPDTPGPAATRSDLSTEQTQPVNNRQRYPQTPGPAATRSDLSTEQTQPVNNRQRYPQTHQAPPPHGPTCQQSRDHLSTTVNAIPRHQAPPPHGPTCQQSRHNLSTTVNAIPRHQAPPPHGPTCQQSRYHLSTTVNAIPRHTRPRRHTVRPVDRAEITPQQPSTLSPDTRPRRHTVRPVNRTEITCQQPSTLSPDTPGPAATRSDLSTEQISPVNNRQRYPQTPGPASTRSDLSTEQRSPVNNRQRYPQTHQAPPPHGPTCRQSRDHLSTTVNAIPRHTRPRRHTVRPVNRADITCQQPSTLSPDTRPRRHTVRPVNRADTTCQQPSTLSPDTPGPAATRSDLSTEQTQPVNNRQRYPQTHQAPPPHGPTCQQSRDHLSTTVNAIPRHQAPPPHGPTCQQNRDHLSTTVNAIPRHTRPRRHTVRPVDRADTTCQQPSTLSPDTPGPAATRSDLSTEQRSPVNNCQRYPQTHQAPPPHGPTCQQSRYHLSTTVNAIPRHTRPRRHTVRPVDRAEITCQQPSTLSPDTPGPAATRSDLSTEQTQPVNNCQRYPQTPGPAATRSDLSTEQRSPVNNRQRYPQTHQAPPPHGPTCQQSRYHLSTTVNAIPRHTRPRRHTVRPVNRAEITCQQPSTLSPDTPGPAATRSDLSTEQISPVNNRQRYPQTPGPAATRSDLSTEQISPVNNRQRYPQTHQAPPPHGPTCQQNRDHLSTTVNAIPRHQAPPPHGPTCRQSRDHLSTTVNAIPRHTRPRRHTVRPVNRADTTCQQPSTLSPDTPGPAATRSDLSTEQISPVNNCQQSIPPPDTRPRRHTVRPVDRADTTCQQPSTLSPDTPGLAATRSDLSTEQISPVNNCQQSIPPPDTRPRRHTVRPVDRADTTCQQPSTLSPDTPGLAATRSDLPTEQISPVNNRQRYPQTHQAPPPHGPTCRQSRDHLSTTVNAIPRHTRPRRHTVRPVDRADTTCQQLSTLSPDTPGPAATRSDLSTEQRSPVNNCQRYPQTHQAPPPHGPTCQQSRDHLSTTVNAIPRHTRPRRHTVRPVNRADTTCQQLSTLSPDTPDPAATRSDLSTEQTQPVNNRQRYPQTHQAPPPHGPTCQQSRYHLSTTVNSQHPHQTPGPAATRQAYLQSRHDLSTEQTPAAINGQHYSQTPVPSGTR